MKKLFVSVGLVATGVASVHAAFAPDSTDNSKIWSISGTLRGFYDDNYLTTPTKHGSAGLEASPSFSLNVPLQQTEIGVRYTYGLYYYQQRENNGQDPVDQTHQFDLWLDHAFTPRWDTRFEDTVVDAQEPALLTPGASPVAQRVSGDNVANTGTFVVKTEWTRLFSTEVTYVNTFYSYQNHNGTALDPSLSGLLDRDENTIAFDLQWHVAPETTALVGYQYGQVVYLSSEPIAPAPGGGVFKGSSRDNRSHYFYVGAQHQFLDNLTASAKVGAEYTSYYADTSAGSEWSPYADASLIYTYAAGSYMQLGVTQSRNATDAVGVNSNGQITQDQESTVVYGSVNHAITPNLTASAVGKFQYSTYNGGQLNDENAKFYNLGLDLSYAFNRNLSADVGYNFDWYTTAAPGQDYTRNRVYLGVTASY